MGAAYMPTRIACSHRCDPRSMVVDQRSTVAASQFGGPVAKIGSLVVTLGTVVPGTVGNVHRTPGCSTRSSSIADRRGLLGPPAPGADERGHLPTLPPGRVAAQDVGSESRVVRLHIRIAIDDTDWIRGVVPAAVVEPDHVCARCERYVDARAPTRPRPPLAA